MRTNTVFEAKNGKNSTKTTAEETSYCAELSAFDPSTMATPTGGTK
jgi:hypothetical protein